MRKRCFRWLVEKKSVKTWKEGMKRPNKSHLLKHRCKPGFFQDLEEKDEKMSQNCYIFKPVYQENRRGTFFYTLEYSRISSLIFSDISFLFSTCLSSKVAGKDKKEKNRSSKQARKTREVQIEKKIASRPNNESIRTKNLEKIYTRSVLTRGSRRDALYV